ncbi:MAG: hypothetical protein ABR562_00145 [Thermoplasmatota archaeon]
MRTFALAGLAAMLLLAGCAQTSTPGATTTSGHGIASGEPNGPGGHPGGALVRPSHADNESQGLRLEGDEDASGMSRGGSVTFTFVATNVGADATTHGACEKPYAFTLRDAHGKEMPLDVPMAHCMVFSDDPFAAGAKMDFSRAWNGTYAEGDHLVDAPEGAYTLTATFTAWRGDVKAEVSVTLPVNIVRMNEL